MNHLAERERLLSLLTLMAFSLSRFLDTVNNRWQYMSGYKIRLVNILRHIRNIFEIYCSEMW